MVDAPGVQRLDPSNGAELVSELEEVMGVLQQMIVRQIGLPELQIKQQPGVRSTTAVCCLCVQIPVYNVPAVAFGLGPLSSGNICSFCSQ